MSAFADKASALEARDRLSGLLGSDVGPFLDESFVHNPDPDTALKNLERWLASTGNPRLYLEQILGLPHQSRSLLLLMGASQPLADTLIQNPELATALLEPSEEEKMVERQAVIAEGRRLLAASTSSSHSLDRLRYLKQRLTIPIVVNDLKGTWPQEQVWRALSNLAEALIELALEATWPSFASSRQMPERPPLGIVVFGKLGASELNYSSDIDLVYICEDGLDERSERECTRYCEVIGRALSDKMGRGALYRVDLRLRPYGASGPLLRSIGSVETYYRLYAEAWEIQALVKSRLIAGVLPPERWEALIDARVYARQVSDSAVAEMLAMRRRIEEEAKGDDLKRGPGGIRDVEFLCQTLQLVSGGSRPSVRCKATCDAIRALADERLLEGSVAGALIEGYTFLRKLEHRIQLVGDRQTHTVPTEPASRLKLARLMGMDSWNDLEAALEFQRRTIQTLYRSILRQETESKPDAEWLASMLGEQVHALRQWFDVFPEPESFYRSLVENEGSLSRVTTVLRLASTLVTHFKNSLQLTELLLSGEIEEDPHTDERIATLPVDSSPRQVAEAVRSAESMACARWALTRENDLQADLQRIREALVRHTVARLCADFDVVALGSFGSGDMTPNSDVDLVLLTPGDQPSAELTAQSFLLFLGQLKRFGTSFEVDLRLRPEGGKGLLVRTYAGFQAYELSGMEMWERFALGPCRPIFGSEEASRIVLHAAYALPLTPGRLQELVKMKRRIETERVLPQHSHRDVKLGLGSLSDIEWTVHLTEMRYPTAARVGEPLSMDARIRNLGRASLLNALEVDELIQARRHLLDVRTWIYLLGYKPDLLPENPDRLDRLAEAMGQPNGNEILRRHRAVTEWVRALYLQTLERLRA